MHVISSSTFTLLIAELEVTNLSADYRTRVTVHAVQLMPRKPYRAHESQSFLSIEPEQKETMILPIIVRFLVYIAFVLADRLCDAIGWAYSRAVPDSVLV